MTLPPSLEEGHYYSLPAAHFANKAVSLRRLGLQELALEACGNALKFDPDLVEVLLNKGVILQALNRYQEAVDCFNMILQLEGPSYARIRWAALYNKANAQRSLGLNQEALRCMAEVIKEEPSAAAFQTKGDILLELGLWQEAGEAFDEAIQLDPSSFHAWTQIGFVLSEYAQLYEEGNRFYDCALVLDPRAFQWRVHKGINLFRLGRFQDAVDCFDVVLSMNREFVNAWYEKGLALCKLNQNAAALGCFEETLRLDPKFAHAWEYKGLLLLQEHKFDAALVCLRRATALGVKGLERSIKLCEDSLE
jgi:tetratricopeptide (TPR) repeat protein